LPASLKYLCILAYVFLLALLAPRVAWGQAGISGTILQLSGDKRVKIVWQRDTTPAGDNVFGGANVFRLMGYDTDDDAIRTIQNSLDDYTKPLFTHDGSRIVYSDRVERKVFVCGWDGSGIRQLASGFAGAVWFDSASSKEWVYFQEGGDGDNNPLPVKRVNLDNTGEIELVWDDSDTNAYWMSISSDGARIASSWPWPQCGASVPAYDGSGGGTIYIPDSGYYTTGCWTTITPDTSYRVGVFDGPHRGWQVWDWPVGTMRLLDLHSAPGIDGWEIYHPKMSNNPRFLAITGPYSNGTMGDNNIGAGGTQIEIYLGKLDTGFSQVTDWVKVTNNSQAEFFPDVWVDPGTSNQVSIDSFSVTPNQIVQGASATLAWQTTNTSTVSINQGIGTVAADGSRDVSPAADTTYTLTADGPGGPVTRQVSLSVVSFSLPAAINCGDGTPLVAGWADEDVFRSGGEEYDFTGSVDINGQPNAAPADVYLTCVHYDHSYSFPVPNGSYTVRLHFYDAVGASGRAMDYTIEGVRVLDDFSITAAAGGGGKALVREFPIEVTDGDGLQIVAEKDQGNDAFEAGIEILEGSTDDQDPVVVIDSPTDGAVLSGDVAVSGTATDNVAVSRVEISLDGGAWDMAVGTDAWSYTIYQLALSDGPHTITARATDTSGNQGSTSVQFSANNQPSITILSPAGGESWQAGGSGHIRWTTENLSDVTIRFSADGGANYSEIVPSLSDADPDWGDYTWQIPNEGTDQARILIHGYFDSSVKAESNLFTIVVAGNPIIDLLTPQAGDSLTGGDTQSISWNATDVETVVLEYSLDGGSNYLPISTLTLGDPAWGDFQWTVPDAQSEMAEVRARTPSGDVQDVSGLFSIEPKQVASGDLELSSLKISGKVSAGAGTVSQVHLGGKTFPVSADGTFEAQIDLAPGVEITNQTIESDDASVQRLFSLEIKDAQPPIDGLLVSAEDLRAFVGGRSGVLVWVDAGGAVKVLDFRVQNPEVQTLSGSLDSVNPLISPDGTRVVYSQGRPNGPKNIFVSTLDGSSAGQVAAGDVGYFNFSSGEESIVYCDWSDKSENGADGKTYRLELTPGGVTPLGDPVELCSRAMDAGPDKELGWLGQVYENLWAYDLANQKDYPTEKFFLLSGAVADHQTCNGSMAPDDSARLMCLVIPHDYVRIFSYTTSSDDFRQTSEFRLPQGMTEWEFPEWSTDPGYFTAILRASDLQNRLFIVKVDEGDLVPEVLQITDKQTGATYSHLYLEP
jgi:hypothetical protein